MDGVSYQNRKNGNAVIVEEKQLVDEPEEETQLDEPLERRREPSPDWEDGEEEEEAYL